MNAVYSSHVKPPGLGSAPKIRNIPGDQVAVVWEVSNSQLPKCASCSAKNRSLVFLFETSEDLFFSATDESEAAMINENAFSIILGSEL